jgi:hypothetical protein
MRRRGYDPTTLKPIAPGGQQTQTPKYKRMFQGPGGHLVGTNDDGKTYYDVQTGALMKTSTDKNGQVTFVQ